MKSELLRRTALRLVCDMVGFRHLLAIGQTAVKMKMITDIPPQIKTPDSVETRIGTLQFFDGFPNNKTTLPGRGQF